MSVETALNVRDKSRMKSCSGPPVSPAPATSWSPTRARRWRSPKTSASRSSPSLPPARERRRRIRLDDLPALRGWLEAIPPRVDGRSRAARGVPGRGRAHLRQRDSRERDRLFVDLRLLPTPLEVLRQPWIQWTVVLPREQNGPGYERIWEVGPAALRALGVRDAVTHMEWFRRPDGSIAVSEVAARPPGAQITSMLGYVHDVDFYRAGLSWSPSARSTRRAPVRGRYRVSAGAGCAAGSGGSRRRRAAARDRRSRRRGPASGGGATGLVSYEGEGYVIVRHPETQVVRDAVRRIITRLRIELVEAQ